MRLTTAFVKQNKLTLDQVELLLIERLAKRGFKTFKSPHEQESFCDRTRRLVKVGTLDKTPTAILATLAHEYIHGVIREPKRAGRGLCALMWRPYLLDGSLPGLAWEFRVWVMSERLLRRLAPSGFKWGEFYRLRRSIMKHELRRLARSL